jgi:hypothetical protein
VPTLDANNDTTARSAALFADWPVSRQTCVVICPFVGYIHPETEFGLNDLRNRGYDVIKEGGHTQVDLGRSMLATKALNDGYEQMMWIDHDVGFQPDAVERLRSHNLPFISACYPKKGQAQFCSAFHPSEYRIQFGTHARLHRLRFAASGFTLVHRTVYERIAAEVNMPVCNQQHGTPIIPFYMPMVWDAEDGPMYLGEDYAFSIRATDVGYPPWADCSIRLNHWGMYPYSWEDVIAPRERIPSVTIKIPSNQPQTKSEQTGG